ncbi:hypothetical protein Ct61P_04408 [Colletotrichum tofieldiae]|nr:hypothetical protein Ct61P_04408 [Colletotrichum tofieldiae]
MAALILRTNMAKDNAPHGETGRQERSRHPGYLDYSPNPYKSPVQLKINRPAEDEERARPMYCSALNREDSMKVN